MCRQFFEIVGSSVFSLLVENFLSFNEVGVIFHLLGWNMRIQDSSEFFTLPILFGQLLRQHWVYFNQKVIGTELFLLLNLFFKLILLDFPDVFLYILLKFLNFLLDSFVHTLGVWVLLNSLQNGFPSFHPLHCRFRHVSIQLQASVLLEEILHRYLLNDGL